MKREDVRKIFPEATTEQVDAILNGFGSEINPLKAQLEDATAKLGESTGALSGLRASEAALKARLEEANARLQQGMSAEELLAQREAAAAQRERDFTMKSNSLDAKAVFVEAGFDADDIEALLPRVVTEDAEATVAAANALVALDAKRRAAVEQSVKDELLKKNPSPQGAGSGTSMTKKEFASLSYDDQMKFVKENPGALKSLK